jgi:hypothetical protein
MEEEIEGTCWVCGGAIDPDSGEPNAARVLTGDGRIEEWCWHSRCFGEAAPDPSRAD